MEGGPGRRYILHADFDAFYAAVEQRDNPRLRGRPVVVGGRPEARGVVASASYEARRYGVRSAMPMRTALRLCPHAVRVDPRFDRYREVSRRVMSLFRRVTPLVEPLSLDEAFLDITDVVTDDRTPERVARWLKAQVRRRVGLTISVGVASGKAVAKIASDLEKPDGLVVVPPGAERDFLAPMPVGRLWGVGPRTAERLARLGIRTIGDLAAQSEGWARQAFGRWGPQLVRLARGQDPRPVEVARERKSVSAEVTLARDTDDAEALRDLVARLAERVSEHLKRRDLQGRTVRLKLRLADFTTFTRQRTLERPVGTAGEVSAVALALLERELRPGRLFRLVGVGVAGFERGEGSGTRQLPLAGLA